MLTGYNENCCLHELLCVYVDSSFVLRDTFQLGGWSVDKQVAIGVVMLLLWSQGRVLMRVFGLCSHWKQQAAAIARLWLPALLSSRHCVSRSDIGCRFLAAARRGL